MSYILGYVSYRNPLNMSEPGSWYIQLITNTFINKAHELNVMEMLQQVSWHTK